MAFVQVKSSSETGIVQKMYYRARGPFKIIELLDDNSYMDLRHNKTPSSPRKYKGVELYLFSPNRSSHTPLDSMDEWYLN